MTAMKFLAVFDGNVNYQDSGGTGTLTNDGAQTYAASSFTGHQGVSAPEIMSLAATTNAANPASGAMIARVKAPSPMGSFYEIVWLGAYPTGPYLGLRFWTTGELQVEGNALGSFSVNTGQSVTAGQIVTAYMQWDGATVKAALGSNALVSTAKVSTQYFPTGGKLTVGARADNSAAYGSGGRFDAVAIFDGPLTDAQRAYLAGLTTPWTWGMALSAPIAGYIDVLPSAGANTGAPTLTLP